VRFPFDDAGTSPSDSSDGTAQYSPANVVASLPQQEPHVADGRSAFDVDLPAARIAE
jgi:hypothetical protein